MPDFDATALAKEMLHVFQSGSMAPALPSVRYASFDLNAAYAAEAEFARLRREAGRKTTGLKVGYANAAVLRALKMDTLVWAHMYDDTVHHATTDVMELALLYYRSPKIEPEIVFKLKQPITTGDLDAAAILENVEWLAIGFEIIDCPFPEWQFKPADFVAAFGLHLGLAIGQPLVVEPSLIPALADSLAKFKVRVFRDGEFVEEGSGKNSFRSPARCLAELGGALLKQLKAEPLSAGDLISSGTLTAGHPIASGETWTVEVDGLLLPNLTIRFVERTACRQSSHSS
jgi:2-oxo-3-hexenedioate decarboxylase